MADITALVAELRDEHDELAGLLRRLPSSDWRRRTPAPRWTIAHQVAHLTYFENAARLAVAEPGAFAGIAAAAAADPAGFGEAVLSDYVRLPAYDLLEAWQNVAAAARTALAAAPAGTRVPWFGPEMSIASKISARIMETWAHGQDIYDAMGATREPTERLRHIVGLARRARPYSYQVNGRPMPPKPVRLELTGPGAVSEPGPGSTGEDVDEIRGTALDFCLVLTRRRHVDDTLLVAEGAAAAEWLLIGQAYAGEPGRGREAGQFVPPAAGRARGPLVSR